MTKATTTGMSMLLVLFSQDKSTNTNTKFHFPSPSKSLLSKAQSTISICALLFFTTLLLFTLSTLPPTPPPTPPSYPSHTPPSALHRMGTLHRRGTKSMPDLLICHVSDQTPLPDFRLFLRLLHRSSLTATSDVVFLFPSPSSSPKYSTIIQQENHAFSSLLDLHAHLNSTRWHQHPKSSFDPNRFKTSQQQQREPLWGTKTRPNLTTIPNSLSYGSVLSFDATELDPENSLAGFLDRVPLTLRRWACYPMLLGRVRRNFKHVMLVDVKSVLILKDPLARVRTRTPDSVFLFSKSEKHGKRNQRAVLSAVVMGGARGVRRLSGAVMLEIVRAATQHKKKKNSVTESAILSQLVGGSEFVLRNKNVHLVASCETIPEVGASTASFSDFAMVQRGVSNNQDLNYVIMRQLCSSVVDSSVYRDC